MLVKWQSLLKILTVILFTVNYALGFIEFGKCSDIAVQENFDVEKVSKCILLEILKQL